MTVLRTAHPGGEDFESDPWRIYFFWRGDGGEEGDVAFVTVAGVAGHVAEFGVGPKGGSGGPPRGEMPFQLSGHSDDAGTFPIGVKFGLVFNVNSYGKRFSRDDGGVLGNEAELETNLFVYFLTKEEGRNEREEKQKFHDADGDYTKTSKENFIP